MIEGHPIILISLFQPPYLLRHRYNHGKCWQKLRGCDYCVRYFSTFTHSLFLQPAVTYLVTDLAYPALLPKPGAKCRV